MLVNIIDGRPEGYLTIREAANKLGVSFHTIRHYMMTNDEFKKYVLHLHGDGSASISYISEMAEKPKKKYFRKPLPGDYLTNVIHALDLSDDYDISHGMVRSAIYDHLTPRERRIIELTYQDNMTLDEIGKEFNLTRERVRQIRKKAMCKIITHIRIAHEEAERAKSIGSINELNLSVRAYNCLARAGITSIADLVTLSEDKILHIRNLGQKTYLEIVDEVHSHGYFFEWEVSA